MDIETLSQLISTVGFPIVVAVFVLWRLNGKMEHLAVSLERLTIQLDILLQTPPKRD